MFSLGLHELWDETPFNRYWTTEGNTKGNAFPSWKRVNQKGRCCWCLSHIFLPVPKSLAEGSYVCQWLPLPLCLSAFSTPKAVLQESWKGWGFNTLGTTLNQNEIGVGRWISQFLHLLEGEFWAVFLTFFQRSPAGSDPWPTAITHPLTHTLLVFYYFLSHFLTPPLSFLVSSPK